MSVEITFGQDEAQGLVAKGTSLWEAARRLGVSLRADCQGRGECDTCAMLIIQGAELLSPANQFELTMLGQERLDAAERLACQTKLDKTGEVIVRRAPIPAVSFGNKKESGKAFRDLPLKQQVGAFIELEATTISEAVNALREKSNALVAKFLNLKPQEPGATPEDKGERNAPAGNS